MSDSELAGIGRNLAQWLMRRAKERDPESAKQVLLYHTELCAAYRAELREADTGAPAKETPT